MSKQILFQKNTSSAAESEMLGRELGELILSEGQNVTFVAMYGDLGAGKTAFVRGMSDVLTPGAIVTSPTYALMNIYESGQYTFYHLDLYRITTDDDLWSIGFYELFDDRAVLGGKKTVIAAEWCENIPFGLPETYIRLTILRTGDTERGVTAERIVHHEDTGA